MSERISVSSLRLSAFCFAAVTLAGIAVYVAEHSAAQQLPFRDPKLPIEERVNDLLSRMTLEEKVAQTMCLWMEKPNDNSRVPKEQMPLGGEFSPDLAKQKMPLGIGQFARQREYRGAKRA